MNKSSLWFAILCSVFVGFELGRMIYAPESITGLTWIVLILNSLSVIINTRNLL